MPGPTPFLDLGPLLSPSRVAFLPAGMSRCAALDRLIDLTAAAFFTASDRAAFAKAIHDREELTSTAIGGGIAIPHARLPSLPGCLVSVGLAPTGIDFAARDGKRVHLVLMIAARDCDRSEHLRVLASAAALLRDPARRQRILGARDGAEAVAAIAG